MLGRCCAIGTLVSLACCGGCGSDMPFDLMPVHGKVTYEDGGLIKADSVLVTFNPAGPVTGPVTPPGGSARLNVADGTFAAVTTRRTDDGIVAGRYKVVVVPFDKDANGNPRPTKAVAAKYQKESTTPIEVDIDAAEQFIELKVSQK
jgi:hypothetical protein